MSYPKNAKEAFEIMLEKQLSLAPPNQHNRIRNEFSTALCRFALPGLGFQRSSYTAKLTRAEKKEALAYAETLSIKCLPKLLESLEIGFDLAKASKNSQATYGARLRSALVLVENEPWYPGKHVYNRRLAEECRPRMRHGRGNWYDQSLMQNKGKAYKYCLEDHEVLEHLREQFKQFLDFCTALNHFDRCFDSLADGTVDGYIYGLKLWLGWFVHEENPSIDLHTLTLGSLIPVVHEEELDDLTEKQRKKYWRQRQQELDDRISRYFDFLFIKQNAESPRTHLLKLAALLIAAKFLYASQVESVEEYNDIPIIRTINKRMEQEEKDIKEWEKNRRYVADQTQKWPEPPEGQTVLEYTQQAVIETLRLECRPRQSTGDFCKGHIIAKSLLIYLMFVDMGLLPCGRQQEPRSYRIALSCPVKRPDTVPADGVYWPLPPDWAREKDKKGRISDNYLYRTYYHEGTFYPDGIWVYDIRNYKTDACHGVRVKIIPNLMFEDGHRLYDYIERYLCGQWYVGNFRNSPNRVYDWWDPKLRGTIGKWLSNGRAEFVTEETPLFFQEGKSEDWLSSYLFIAPTTGRQFIDRQLSEYFARNSFRIIGKRITPHTFRYMWATFAAQKQFSDAELRSLATAMGNTPETLRRMYERMSPTERNRPVNEAIQQLLPGYVDPSAVSPDRRVDVLKQLLAQLSPQERAQLLADLADDSAA